MTQQNILYLQAAQSHISSPRWITKIKFLYTLICINTFSKLKFYMSIKGQKLRLKRLKIKIMAPSYTGKKLGVSVQFEINVTNKSKNPTNPTLLMLWVDFGVMWQIKEKSWASRQVKSSKKGFGSCEEYYVGERRHAKDKNWKTEHKSGKGVQGLKDSSVTQGNYKWN